MINFYGTKLIKQVGDNKYFNNTDIKGGVSYFYINKNYISKTIKFNDTYLDLSNLDIIPNDTSSSTFSLINKINNSLGIQSKFNSQSHFGIKTNDKRLSNNGEVLCYVSKQKGNVKYISGIDFNNTKINKWKLIIPSASGKGGMLENFYNRIEVAKPGEVCSESFVFFDFDTEEELLFFKSYIETNFFSYFVRLRKIKQHVTSDIFKWVPLVTFDRNWSDDMLIDLFCLNQNEIQHLENIKI